MGVLKVINSDAGWSSSGVRLKPELCKLCPNAAIGKGFCPDWVPDNPLVAFLFDMPSGDDVLEQSPLAGAQGWVWQKTLITDLGYKKSDILLSHAIRCKQPNDAFGKPKYPSNFIQKPAELNCRQYDGQHGCDNEVLAGGGLNEFDPNVFVITLHPRTIRNVGAHQIQIQRDVQKAFEFAKKGWRPAVLFGEGPAELYFPWMKNNGGMKNWRGHYWVGHSPFKDNEKNQKKLSQKSFVEGVCQI